MANETMYIAKEVIPGMAEQGKGLKLYVESEYAPLKACYVGNPSAVMIPDPDSPEMGNLFSQETEEFRAWLRKYKHKPIAEAHPPTYEAMKRESDALAEAFRREGVKVVRNETGHTPESLVNLHTGWGGEPSQSLYGKSLGMVYGNDLVAYSEVSNSSMHEYTMREAIVEMFQDNPETNWLTLPPLWPTNEFPNIGPFMAPDPKVFKKTVLVGIGVSDPSHIDDLTKPRSACNELGAEVLRRMMEPFGWKVETVYFDSRFTYHIDCLITMLEEGLMAYPKGSLWTELPEEYKDWEVIDVPIEDHKKGAENAVVLGDKRIVIVEGTTGYKKKLEDRGWRLIEVPYSTIWDRFHSGPLCSTFAFWRES